MGKHFHLLVLLLGDAAFHLAVEDSATFPFVNLVNYKSHKQKFGTGKGLVYGRLGSIIKSGYFSLFAV